MTNNDSQPMPRMRPPLHKRQFIVDRPFQHRLIGTLMTIWLSNSLFFTLVLYSFYEGHLLRFYTLVPQAGLRPILSPPVLFFLSMAFVYVFGFIVLFIIALYMSNQIAGPLYRTKMSMDKVGAGDLEVRLQFRQDDFLRDIPPVFNRMVENLRKQADLDLDQIEALEEALDHPAECKRLLRELRTSKEARRGKSAVSAPAEHRQAAIVAT